MSFWRMTGISLLWIATFSIGLGLGWFVAMYMGALEDPDVIIRERWMLPNSTTTTTFEGFSDFEIDPDVLDPATCRGCPSTTTTTAVGG